MSQTSYLEAVVAWDEKTCRQNLEEALPKLITCLHEASVFQEEVGILKILCQSFLPYLSIELAENQLFSNITEKACSIFDNVTRTIQDNVTEKQKLLDVQQDVEALLQLLIDLLDCMHVCIQHVQASEKSVHLCQIHSLNLGTVHFLKGTYSHCKESGTLYGELLASVSELLSSLFKRAHILQLSYLTLLDKVKVEETASEDDVRDLCSICYGMFEVSCIVSSLDVKLVISLWKFISKCSSQYKTLLTKRLEVGSMVSHLCSEIKTGYTYLFQMLPHPEADELSLSQGDEKAFKKSVKILGFQVKILVVLVREYTHDLDNDCEMQIYSLLLEFHKCLPPSLYAPPLAQKHVDEIHRQLMNATEPLTTSLLDNKQFRLCVTASVRDIEEDMCLPTLLIQMLILDCLPKTNDSTQSKWISPVNHSEDVPRLGIIASVFRSVGDCSTELSLPVYLPGIMCSGKAQREVSLYEHICVHLCGYIGSFPASDFNVLEESLLENIMSRNPHISALAIDAWCFMARYGTADLCRHHIHLLFELCHRLNIQQLLWFPGPFRLLHRLIRFMAVEHQQELVKEYPPLTNVTLWTELPPSLWMPSVCRDITDEICNCCIKGLHNFISITEKKNTHFCQLINFLNCLNGIYHQSETVQKYIMPKTQAAVVEKLCGLLSLVTTDDWLISPLASICLGQVIQLHMHLLSAVNNTNVLKLFTLISAVLERNPSEYLRLSITLLLKGCGHLKIPPSSEQTQILNKISDIFSKLLSDGSLFILHMVLEAFTKFAEETVHESVVPQCFVKQPDLQKVMVAFLNKIPCGAEAVPNLQMYLKQQSDHILERVSNGPQVAAINLQNPDKTEEPSSKRQKVENPVE
ncbi:hypothetical protein ScPMuIL_010232, partial [Solemya velum]